MLVLRVSNSLNQLQFLSIFFIAVINSVIYIVTFHWKQLVVLVSRIQNSGTADNNFGKWKRTFRSDRPNEMTRPVTMDHLQSWGPFLESPGNFTGAKSNIQIEI